MNPAIRNRSSRIVLVLAAAAWVTSATAPAFGVTQLRRGDTPPPIELNGIDGRPFKMSDQQGRPVVLLFGELYHEKSLAAARAITEILRDSRLADSPPVCAMIVAQQADAAVLRKLAADRGVALSIVHDRDRVASAAYEVSVLPSVIVVDPQGHVVHALAGLSAAFKDIVTDAVLLAAGQLGESAAVGTLAGRPTTAPAESSESRRAVRLTELARQLARGGMNDLAAEKYREALKVDSRCVPALLGLGSAAIKGRRLAEAEQHYRDALTIEPSSTEAALGLASVLMLRGGGELPQAEGHVRSVLAVRPNDPEAHYLLGQILEQSGKSKEAMASYRRAAELSLHRGG